MKNLMIAAGVATALTGGAMALTSSPAQASWAEGPQAGVAVYTGTAQNDWRAQRGRRGYSEGRGYHRGYDRGYHGYHSGPSVSFGFGGGYNDGYYYR